MSSWDGFSVSYSILGYFVVVAPLHSLALKTAGERRLMVCRWRFHHTAVFGFLICVGK